MPIKLETKPQRKLGTLIRLGRVAAGMTQRQLAEVVCISQCMISKYESGITVPDALTLQAIAKALGQPLAYFQIE